MTQELSFLCTTCDATEGGMEQGLRSYAAALKTVRERPWEDYEFVFACPCGKAFDEAGFTIEAWTCESLRRKILEFGAAHADVFRDDSWSYGALAIPGQDELVALPDELFQVLLSQASLSDFDHAHDDFYAFFELWEALAKSDPGRAKSLLAIFQQAGSGVVDELLASRGL